MAAANRREDGGTDEREEEAHPVNRRGVRVAAPPRQQNRDRGAKRRDLRKREIDKNDTPLDDVHAQIGVNAGDHEARDEWCREEGQDCQVHVYLAPVCLMAFTTRLTS